MTRTLLTLLLLTGCAPDDSSGTSVGNPGLFAMQAAPGDGVDIVAGWGHTDRALLHDCVDDEEEVGLEPRGFGEVQALPAGRWCAMEFVMIGELELEVIVPALSGDAHVVSIPLEALGVGAHAPFTIESDGEYVLEFAVPGWLREDHFDLEDENVFLREEANKELLKLLVMGSAFYADLDTDGELDDDERDKGALAAGNPDDAINPDEGSEDEDNDSNTTPDCGSGGSLAFLPWLVAPLWRRRKLNV